MAIRMSSKDFLNLGWDHFVSKPAAERVQRIAKSTHLDKMPVSLIAIRVDAEPVAQPRHRSARNGRHYIPADHPIHAFKQMVQVAARMAYSGLPFLGAVEASATFVFPRPKRLVWKKRPMPRELHTAKPDYDNLLKSVFDALSGILWVDDSQIARSGFGEKVIAAGDEQPHVTIEVRRID